MNQKNIADLYVDIIIKVFCKLLLEVLRFNFLDCQKN